jgi:hypothetical protein
LPDAPRNVNRCPADSDNYTNFPNKVLVDFARVQVIAKKLQTQPVHKQRDDLRAKNVTVQFVDGSDDIENLRQDQRRESDRNNPYKRLFEQFQAHHHDHHSLVNAHPHPNEKRLRVQIPRLPQCQVQVRVKKCLLPGNVSVKHEGEHRQRCVKCSIT